MTFIIVGVRKKVQGQRGTTNENLFQQNDPSQRLPTALKPALNQQLTSGCQQGNTHSSRQWVSLHILQICSAWTCVLNIISSSPVQNVLSRYLMITNLTH